MDEIDSRPTFNRVYNEGRAAASDGKSRDANPWKDRETIGKPGRVWQLGYDKRLAEMTEATRLDDLECDLAEMRRGERLAYYSRFAAVADKLSDLGIDPHELRDYLAGLPD